MVVERVRIGNEEKLCELVRVGNEIDNNNNIIIFIIIIIAQ